MQSYNGSLKKKIEEWIIIQMVRNFEVTLKLKYCSRSSLLQVLPHKAVQKTNKTLEKNPRWRTKSERPLAVSLTICEVNEMHLWKSWRDHQGLQLKLFIFPLWKCLHDNVWVFVRLCETKIGEKSKIVLNKYRQLYSLHENRRHLLSYCKIC